MADAIRRTEHIWLNGNDKEFNVYRSSNNLHQLQYAHSSGAGPAPVEHQKNQICLHYTAANNPGQNTISYWSQHAPVPHAWVCPRYFSNGAANCNWGTAHQWMCSHAGCAWTGNSGRCPAHNARQKNQCPTHHVNVEKGRIRASAHYIVEVAQDRLNSAQEYSDVIEVVNSEYVTWHAGVINTNSVGIEIANVGWNFVNMRHDAATGAGANRRPADPNRYLSVPAAVLTPAMRRESNFSHHDFQAYQEEQYGALIFLLRSLCIKHSIPRVFLGDTTHEKMKRWWHNVGSAREEAEKRSRVMRFRGILSHMNVHDGKECGGPALHRNRLYRGIIDEWWMPIQIEGQYRPYYTGPFNLSPNVAGLIRFNGTTPQADLFRDADLDALQETRSYFDFDHVDWYYANTETAHSGDQHGIGSGAFPIGSNKIWHGGVHLFPQGDNKNVYAAASGTIVAARIAGETALEQDLNYGSQCFVLIRHAVYHQTTTDDDGGMSIDYTTDPTWFFSLYMHLKPIPAPGANDTGNPPWYNLYLSNNTAPSPAQSVFCPDIEVMVGDVLGVCGPYRGRDIIHFEIMSNFELNVAPWDSADLCARDTDTNITADTAVIDALVQDAAGDGIDMTDVLRAMDRLRLVKSYYRSEWALQSRDNLDPVVPESRREAVWEKLRHFMWVSDAIAACPDLETQLCDRTGFFWHYHPITFMKFVNNLIREQNGETDESRYSQTNVEIDNGFLTRFLRRPRWSCPQNNDTHRWFADSGQCPTHSARQANTGFITQAADSAAIRPYEISSTTFDYTLTREQIACSKAGNHAPGPTPPTETRLCLALADIVESVRQRYGSAITVGTAHLCSTHGDFSVAANRRHCVLGTEAGLTAHKNGVAIDIGPAGDTAPNARRLWEAVEEVVEAYNTAAEAHGGEASRASIAEGYGEATFTPPAAPGAAPRLVHIELGASVPTTVWECWIRKPSQATDARVENRTIIGMYTTEAAARTETLPSTTVTPAGTMFENVIRQNSHASRAKVYAEGIIGVFPSREEAEAEKSRDVAWPKTVQ